MKCKKFKIDMNKYIDEELTLVEENELKAHLEECLGCNEKMSEFKKVVGILNRIKGPKNNENFTNNLMNKLDKQKYKNNRPHIKLLYVAAVFLFLFVTLPMLRIQFSQNTYIVQPYIEENVIKQDNEFIIPENVIIEGDLTIVNGNIKVLGTVTGNVKAIKGEVLLSPTAQIKGKSISNSKIPSIKEIYPIIKRQYYQFISGFVQ